jgi:hypothetical protein
MKKILTGAAGVVALTLTALTAHASCMDPRAATKAGAQEIAPLSLSQGTAVNHWERNDAAEKIVGTWHVLYTADGASAPYAQAFIQWHSDRTEWENITLPVLGGNICMGSWKVVDQWHVSRNHVGWLFDNTGIISGYFNETETVEVSEDGNSYKGNNDTILRAMSGTVLMEIKATSAASRIAP